MYLDQLSDVEKHAFSRLAYLLISYYGIDEHEEKLYYSALAEMGLDTPELEGEIDPTIEAKAFSSPASRRIALLELLLLALADGDIEDEEQHMIDFIIQAFGFDAETLDRGWNWVRDWYATYRSGHEFIGLAVLAGS